MAGAGPLGGRVPPLRPRAASTPPWQSMARARAIWEALAGPAARPLLEHRLLPRLAGRLGAGDRGVPGRLRAGPGPAQHGGRPWASSATPTWRRGISRAPSRRWRIRSGGCRQAGHAAAPRLVLRVPRRGLSRLRAARPEAARGAPRRVDDDARGPVLVRRSASP